jgi:malate dehydrogenase (oxaloacetate-decarboxylating)(NADP+)
VLRAVQVVVDENVARPTLIGRPKVIEQRIAKFGLRLVAERDYDLVNTEDDHRFRDYWQTYHQLTARKGVTAQLAKIEMRRRLTLIGAMLLQKGEVDGMLCGTWGGTAMHLQYIDQVIGLREGARTYACMNGLMPARPPGHVGGHPRQLRPDRRPDRRDHRHGGRGDAALRPEAQGGAAVAQQLRHEQPGLGVKMREALAILRAEAPGSRSTARCTATPRSTPTTGTTHAGQPADGRGQPARPAEHRRRQHRLQPAQDAAGGGIAIGPVLLGAAQPVHILTPSATVRRIINMTALTVADANAAR